MITFGALYHMIPKIFGREQMHSIALINLHFWLATIGTVLYIASMWVNGITQGLMWRAIAFYIAGIDGSVLWGALMAFLSLIPAVGSAIIWARS